MHTLNRQMGTWGDTWVDSCLACDSMTVDSPRNSTEAENKTGAQSNCNAGNGGHVKLVPFPGEKMVCR